MKAQQIRLLDVFVIGPVMVYTTTQLGDSNKTLGALLKVFGIATIIYNGRNFLIKRRESI